MRPSNQNSDHYVKAISLPWWAVQVIAWFVFCVISFLSLTLWYGDPRWMHVVHIALQALSGALITWPLAYVLPYFNKGTVLRRIIMHLLGVAIIALVWNIFRMATFDAMITASDIWQDFGGWYFTALLIFGLWVALYYAIHAYSAIAVERNRAVQERLRRVEAESLSREAEMKMLRYQLNPHFLFNTLNSISALVKTNRTQKARDMISQLSRFLRLSLENDGLVDVSLQEEIKTLHIYLDIEKVRYEDRLTTEIDVEDEILSTKIPALILQPLFENAIQYAVANRVEGGTIRLLGYRTGDEVHLIVEDSGTDEESSLNTLPELNKGVGLKNTEGRMTAHYGSAGRVDYAVSVLGGLQVTLRFPFSRQSAIEEAAGT